METGSFKKEVEDMKRQLKESRKPAGPWEWSGPMYRELGAVKGILEHKL